MIPCRWVDHGAPCVHACCWGMASALTHAWKWCHGTEQKNSTQQAEYHVQLVCIRARCASLHARRHAADWASNWHASMGLWCSPCLPSVLDRTAVICCFMYCCLLHVLQAPCVPPGKCIKTFLYSPATCTATGPPATAAACSSSSCNDSSVPGLEQAVQAHAARLAEVLQGSCQSAVQAVHLQEHQPQQQQHEELEPQGQQQHHQAQGGHVIIISSSDTTKTVQKQPAVAAVAAAAPGPGLLSVRVSCNMLEGGTGCAEWEAGLLLGEVVMGWPRLVAGARGFIWLF